METHKAFTYYWTIDEEEHEVTVIRVYCLTEDKKTIVLRIDDFTPYVYLELPEKNQAGDIAWTAHSAGMLANQIAEKVGKHAPIKTSLLMKKKLYYCQLEKGRKKEKEFPFLLCAFSSHEDVRKYSYRVSGRQYFVRGIGSVRCKVHEQDANPILQLVCHRKLPTAGWIKFKGKRVDPDEAITTCDAEYKVSWRNLGMEGGDDIPHPLVCSMDIEVNSTNPNRMPQSSVPGDKVFQISCVLKRDGEEDAQKFLLTLGDPDQAKTGDDITILTFGSEADLLEGYAEFLRLYRPNIVTGYNILGFDIQYMIDRAKENFVYDTFSKAGFMKYSGGRERTIKWSSSAYGDQSFAFLDLEGILHVDLLPLIRRDYKFSSYKLKTVSEFFIGQTKDPLDAKGIFKCYRLGMAGVQKDADEDTIKKGRNAMAICGKYCVQDSALVMKLFDILQTWVGLAEMAKVCNVPMFYLYTKGQQIKVYSQVYKKCMFEDRVVERDGYIPSANERYTGAHVFDPKPGVYDRVVPFDFSSLYPTTIIAYNIDYSTLVPDDNDIPDSACNVIEWEDHHGCAHDKTVRKVKLKASEVICSVKHRYRFIKKPQGVMPSLLESLLGARKNTKREIKELKNKFKSWSKDIQESVEGAALQKMITVLDKRQLAFKVSANSMYGAMGVRRGYLPFMPGAMCTTAWGRQSLLKAADALQNDHHGDLVYGDTDSCYIHFPKIKDAAELWDHCLKVEEEVSKVFPPPMRMAFEEVIYWRFLILTKKRYMYRSCGRDGIVSPKIGKKGVLLARRDNSAFIRNIYEEVVTMIFERTSWNAVMRMLCDRFNELCSARFPLSDFVVTKSIGEACNYKALEPITDEAKLKKKLAELECTDDEYNAAIQIAAGKVTIDTAMDSLILGIAAEKRSEFRKDTPGRLLWLSLELQKALPAPVQLAERMRRRGQRVDAGSRLEYVVTSTGGLKAKQYEKLEHPDYFKQHSDVLRLEFVYYLQLLGNSLDQLLEVAYKQKKFSQGQAKLRIKKEAVCQQIKNVAGACLQFVD